MAKVFPTASYLLPTDDAVSSGSLYPSLELFIPYSAGHVTEIRLYHGYRFIGLPDQGVDMISVNPWGGRKR